MHGNLSEASQNLTRNLMSVLAVRAFIICTPCFLIPYILFHTLYCGTNCYCCFFILWAELSYFSLTVSFLSLHESNQYKEIPFLKSGHKCYSTIHCDPFSCHWNVSHWTLHKLRLINDEFTSHIIKNAGLFVKVQNSVSLLVLNCMLIIYTLTPACFYSDKDETKMQIKACIFIYLFVQVFSVVKFTTSGFNSRADSWVRNFIYTWVQLESVQELWLLNTVN